MQTILEATNAAKAQIIALVNLVFALISSYSPTWIRDQQQAAILAVINGVFALYVGLTYKMSAKRVPDVPAPTVPSTTN